MAVLMLLASFTIPTYQLILSQVQLNSAVNAVSDYMRLAAQRTVTEQTVYGVTLIAGSTSIPMYNVVGANKTVIDTYTLPTNMTLDSVSLGGTSLLSFTTSGAPSATGSITIKDTIRNRTRVIQIRPSGNILNNQAEQ